MKPKLWFKQIKKKMGRAADTYDFAADRRTDVETDQTAVEPEARSGYAADGPVQGNGQPQDNRATVPESSLETMKTGLSTLNNEFDEFTAGSEDDFMLLGSGLQTVYSNVTELTELILGTIKKIGADEEGGFLEKVRQILNASLTEIQTRREEAKADLERINSVMHSIEALYETSKQIKHFAKSLKIVALAMLIENARTIDTSINIFSDVAQEIKDLSVDIANIANGIYNNVEKARAVYRVTREEISAGITRLEGLTAEIHATVDVSTRELMQFSINTIEEAGRRAREISRQVAEVVIGVQFHDNMKQRIMHISTILEAMIASAGPEPAVETDKKVPATKVLREQTIRLEEINLEVYDVYKKNQSALSAIGGQVDDLLRQLQEMVPTDDAGDGRNTLINDPFSRLKDALGQLHDLMERGKTLCAQIQDAADHVSGIAANLSELLGVVRSISANTHNRSINSIIAADRQGEKGGALKLLSQEMNALATQSDGFSNEVETIINAIISSTNDISGSGLKDFDEKEADSAVGQLGEVMDDISLRYEQFRQEMLIAYERARALKQATDTTLTSLDFFKVLSQRLIDYRDQLTAVADQPHLGLIWVDIGSVSTRHVPGKYTADSDDNIILFEDVKKNAS